MKIRISVRFIIVVVIAGVLGLAATGFAGDFDLGGQTVRIGTRYTDYTPFAPRGELNWLSPDARLQAHIEEVEHRFNCKVEFVEGFPNLGPAIVEWLIPQMIVAEPQVDIFSITVEDMAVLAANGMLVPLDDVVDEDLKSQYAPGMWKGEATVAGSLYGLPRLLGEIGLPDVGDGIVWNKTVFEAEGLPNLYEVYEAGDWTWDAFKNLAIKLTADTNGDGVIDRFGVRAGYKNPQILVQWMTTNNATTTRVVDGRVVSALHEPAAIEAFEFWTNLVETGVVGGARGQSAMEYVWTDAIQLAVYQDSDYEWGVVAAPRGPSASEHIAPHPGGWVMSIPITVANPRAVIEVFNALMKLTGPYWDGETMEQRAERLWTEDRRANISYDRESSETMKWSSLNRITPPDYGLLVQFGLGDAVSRMLRGENPASVLAEYTPVFQSGLDEIYKQQ